MPNSKLVILCAALLFCGQAQLCLSNDGVDMVLTNGKIYTVDSAQSWAEAIVIDKGRIVYVGSNTGAEPYRAKARKQVDLGGAMVMPSFQGESDKWQKVPRRVHAFFGRY